MSGKLDLRRMWKERPLARLTAGIILILLGFLISNIPTMILSRGWPSTEGVIISRTLMGQRFRQYDGDYYTNIDGYIHFQYQVDGITYSATAVHPYKTALRYPEGKEVQVYYHPRNPARAELESGWVISRQAVGFLPLVFLLMGFYLLVREGWLKFRPVKSHPERSAKKPYTTKGRQYMNETSSSSDRGPRWTRLVARIWSVPLIVIATLITVGNIWSSLSNAPPDPYAVENPTFIESLPPILLAISILGLALAWRWVRMGGILSLAFAAGAVLVLLFERSGSGDLSRDLIPYLLTLAVTVPGVLFVIYGYSGKTEA